MEGTPISSARTPLTAVALSVALLLGGCSSDEPSATPPSPSQTELPPVEPFEPQVTVASRSVNSGAVMDRTQGAAADQAAVDAMTGAVTSWLDAHLDDLQRGGEGQLAAVAAPGLLENADPAIVQEITTGLTSPQDPVRQASYDLEIGHDGAPRWLRATVSVTGAAGQARTAVFVFVPGDNGPVLVAAEGLGGTT